MGDLDRCVTVKISGTVKYNLSSDRYRYYYTSRRVVSPTMQVTTRSGSCSGPVATVSKVTMEQRWYDYDCDASMSVSVGYPWGVSATPTLSCGNETTAHKKTTYGSGSTFNQYNSSTTVSFSGNELYRSGSTTYQSCFKVTTAVVVYRSTSSDSWAPEINVCYKPDSLAG